MHHAQRLEEVLAIIESVGKSAYSVASNRRWDIRCDSWEAFPAAQKWFATGEAIAHLRFLEEKGRIVRRNDDGIIRFEIRR